jgi:hypothetical protein
VTDQGPGPRPATAEDEGVLTRSSVLLLFVLALVAAASAVVLLTR